MRTDLGARSRNIYLFSSGRYFQLKLTWSNSSLQLAGQDSFGQKNQHTTSSGDIAVGHDNFNGAVSQQKSRDSKSLSPQTQTPFIRKHQQIEGLSRKSRRVFHQQSQGFHRKLTCHFTSPGGEHRRDTMPCKM